MRASLLCLAIAACGDAETAISWTVVDPDGNPVDCADIGFGAEIRIVSSTSSATVPCSPGRATVPAEEVYGLQLVAYPNLVADAVRIGESTSERDGDWVVTVDHAPLVFSLDFDTPSGRNCSGDGGVDTWRVDFDDYDARWRPHYVSPILEASRGDIVGAVTCDWEETQVVLFPPLGAVGLLVSGEVGGKTCYAGAVATDNRIGAAAIPTPIPRVRDFEGCDTPTTRVTFTPEYDGYPEGQQCSGDVDTYGIPRVFRALSPAGEDVCLEIPFEREGGRIVDPCSGSTCEDDDTFSAELPDGDYVLHLEGYSEGYLACNLASLSFQVPTQTALRFRVPATGDCEHVPDGVLVVQPELQGLVGGPFGPLPTPDCDGDYVWSPTVERRIEVTPRDDDTCPDVEFRVESGHGTERFPNCSGQGECYDHADYETQLPEGRYTVTVTDFAWDIHREEPTPCFTGSAEVTVEGGEIRELPIVLDAVVDASWECFDDAYGAG